MSTEFRHFHNKQFTDNGPTTHESLTNWFDSLYHNKGERAELRRCTSPEQVLLTAGFRRLYDKYYQWFNPDTERFLALACAAGVIAHVQENVEDEQKSFAKQMAIFKPDTEQPKVSPMRFDQLQKSYSWDEFYRRLIRIVRLLDKQVNIISMTDAIFHWCKEFNGIYERKPLNRCKCAGLPTTITF